MTDILLKILVNGTTLAIEIGFFLFTSSAKLKIEKLPQKKWKHKLAEWGIFFGYILSCMAPVLLMEFLNSIWPNTYPLLLHYTALTFCIVWWLLFRVFPFLHQQYDEADGRFVIPGKKYGVRQLLPLKAWIVFGILLVIVVLYASVE
jgi:predicted secreted protein